MATKTIIENAGRLDWSSQNKIVFDRRGPDGVISLWTIDPDGSNQNKLPRYGAPLYHRGNPCWHPSGKVVVFQASESLSAISEPGRGFQNNLWLTDIERNFYTELYAGPSALLHPQFFPDGRYLWWSERAEGAGNPDPWTGWWLNSGRLLLLNKNRGARLQQLNPVAPGGMKFYEFHGFHPDGNSVLFSGDPPGFFDIYRWGLAGTSPLVNLTASPTTWDEHAHFSPDGHRIVWASSRDLVWDGTAEHLVMDYWIMDVDGTDKQRLTYFNSGGQRELCGDFAWSPDGKQIAAYLIRSNTIAVIDVL
jgi:Tol biopolymer transport system component